MSYPKYTWGRQQNAANYFANQLSSIATYVTLSFVCAVLFVFLGLTFYTYKFPILPQISIAEHLIAYLDCATQIIGINSAGWFGYNPYFVWSNYFAQAVELRMSLAGIVFTAIFVGGTAIAIYSNQRLAIMHKRGPQIEYSPKKAAKALKRGGKMLNIHPHVPAGANALSRHVFIAGASGGGKTQILWGILNQICGDPQAKLLLHDVKGDFTASLPGRLDRDFAIIAPWDARTWAWDIAKDVINEADAYDFACDLITASDDPIWSNSARMILTGCIVHLQINYALEWSWPDLQAILELPADELQELLQVTYPQAANLIAEPESRTSQSILVTLSSYMQPVTIMCKAWKDVPKEKYIAISDFVHDRAKINKLIIKNSGRYTEIAQSFISAIIGTCTRYMQSDQLSDDSKRKIFAVFDKFKQIGKVENFKKFLEVGRSKGVKCFVAVQSLAQIRENYGEDWTNAMLATMSSWIICQFNELKQAAEISDYLGEQVLMQIDFSGNNYGGQDKALVDDQNAQVGFREERRKLLEPRELSSKLGAGKKGITALLVLFGGEQAAYMLTWPYVSVKTIRPGYMAANWLNGPTITPTTPVEPEEPEDDEEAKAEDYNDNGDPEPPEPPEISETDPDDPFDGEQPGEEPEKPVDDDEQDDKEQKANDIFAELGL